LAIKIHANETKHTIHRTKNRAKEDTKKEVCNNKVNPPLIKDGSNKKYASEDKTFFFSLPIGAGIVFIISIWVGFLFKLLHSYS
jgi:hypothetical protein